MSKRKYMELTPEEQAEFADSVIGMLISRVHRDYSDDTTGFTIQKTTVGKHAGKVMEDIRRGALQPIKHNVRFD